MNENKNGRKNYFQLRSFGAGSLIYSFYGEKNIDALFAYVFDFLLGQDISILNSQLEFVLFSSSLSRKFIPLHNPHGDFPSCCPYVVRREWIRFYVEGGSMFLFRVCGIISTLISM